MQGRAWQDEPESFALKPDLNQQLEQWVGIDVSKAHLDAYIHPQGQQWRIPNTESGIDQLVETLASIEVALVVLEATGGLEQALTVALSGAGVALVVSNPRRGRDEC